MKSQNSELINIIKKIGYFSIGGSIICLLILILSSFFLIKNIDELNFKTQFKSKEYLVIIIYIYI